MISDITLFANVFIRMQASYLGMITLIKMLKVEGRLQIEGIHFHFLLFVVVHSTK